MVHTLDEFVGILSIQKSIGQKNTHSQNMSFPQVGDGRRGSEMNIYKFIENVSPSNGGVGGGITQISGDIYPSYPTSPNRHPQYYSQNRTE